MEHDVILGRDGVVLRPLSIRDVPPFLALVDAAGWTGMSEPLPLSDQSMRDHLRRIIDNPSGLAFAVELEGRLVGRTTLYDLVPGLRVEVGNTIYAREVWGTRVNPTAKLLLFAYAFDQLGVGRVALRCDH